jgi:hypothetical protein
MNTTPRILKNAQKARAAAAADLARLTGNALHADGDQERARRLAPVLLAALESFREEYRNEMAAEELTRLDDGIDWLMGVYKAAK